MAVDRLDILSTIAHWEKVICDSFSKGKNNAPCAQPGDMEMDYPRIDTFGSWVYWLVQDYDPQTNTFTYMKTSDGWYIYYPVWFYNPLEPILISYMKAAKEYAAGTMKFDSYKNALLEDVSFNMKVLRGYFQVLKSLDSSVPDEVKTPLWYKNHNSKKMVVKSSIKKYS